MRDVVELEASPTLHIHGQVLDGLFATGYVEHLATLVNHVIGSLGVILVAHIEILLHILEGDTDTAPTVKHAGRMEGVRHIGRSCGSEGDERGTAPGLGLGSIVVHRPKHFLADIGVLAIVTTEDIGIVGSQAVTQGEDSFAGVTGLRPHSRTGVNLGIDVQTGQQTQAGALVGTGIVGPGGRHIRAVHQVVEFVHQEVEHLGAGLGNGIHGTERRFLGGERNRAEDIHGHPVEIGAQEADLGPHSGHFLFHLVGAAAVVQAVFGRLAQELVGIGNALHGAHVHGVSGVVVRIGPGVGIDGGHPGVAVPGALGGIGRNLIQGPEGADQFGCAGVCELEVFEVAGKELKVNAGQTREIGTLFGRVSRLGGGIGGIQGQGVEVLDTGSQNKHGCQNTKYLFHHCSS